MDDQDRRTHFDRAERALRAGTPPPLVGTPEAPGVDRPSATEAEAAIRTLIRWAGDDPGREGLQDTPGRVARASLEIPTTRSVGR